MMFDLKNRLKLTTAFAPKAAVTDNTAQVSAIFDCADKTGVMLGLVTGTLSDADATFTVLIEEGDNSALSDAAAVADADLIGLESEASFTFAADDSTRKIGYRGKKRYIRATVTPANNTGNLFLAGMWISQGHQQPES